MEMFWDIFIQSKNSGEYLKEDSGQGGTKVGGGGNTRLKKAPLSPVAL